MNMPGKKAVRKDDWDMHNEQVDAASESYKQYMESDYRTKRPAKQRRWPIVLAVLVLILAVAVAVYFVVLKKDSGNSATPSKDKASSSSAGDKSLATAPTKQYTANNFSLSFNYPENWQVSESTGGDKLTVTSPLASLKSASGQGINGKIIMAIRAKGQPLPEFAKGNAVATRDSEMLHYVKPSQSQRASTYLSFLTYPTSTGGMDAMYITGDYGYKTGQAIPAADLAPADPLINVTFVQCNDTQCSHSSPVTVGADTWDNAEIAKPIRDMLQSLTVE